MPKRTSGGTGSAQTQRRAPLPDPPRRGRAWWAVWSGLGAFFILALAVMGFALLDLRRSAPEEHRQVDSEKPPAAVDALSEAPFQVAHQDSATVGGIRVDFDVRTASGQTPASGDAVSFSFALRDASTGQPFEPSTRPAVWADGAAVSGGAGPGCEDRARLYARGNVGLRPDIDLNSYFVLALNNDSTISVIDPIVGVTGISQMYSMVLLKSPGEDWATSFDGRRLFVTMPRVNEIAVIDTERLEVVQNVPAGDTPVRVALDPSGTSLWIANDSTDRSKAGVTVLDARALAPLGHVRTGAGYHALAFARDASAAPQGAAHDPHTVEAGAPARYAYVLSQEDGTLAVVDTSTRHLVKELRLGARPIALDVAADGTLYVADQAEGAIIVVDPERLAVSARISARPGLRDFRFAPGGRWGFALNEAEGTVEVVDATTNRVAHSLAVGKQPDQVIFTSGYGYVRLAGSAEVAVIDLAPLEHGTRPPTVRVVAGQNPPSSQPHRAVASAIAPVQAHDGTVLIANPADQYIYYYMEGMNAPMGGFANASRAPRATRVIDRSLREQAPGEYVATVRLPRPGRYEVIFALLDEPRLIHCFSFEALNSPETGLADHPVRIDAPPPGPGPRAGEPFTLELLVIDTVTGARVDGVTDLGVVATSASGQWNQRARAREAERGTYSVELTFPSGGQYSVALAIPSRDLGFAQTRPLAFTVADPLRSGEGAP